MESSRNLTGLYLSGFIQEGYLPPQERKSTIPSTLYRGHVVKLARRPNSNPHRNSVGRYPMHSLNSGFSGSLIPTKDLKNFRIPDKISQEISHKVHGKWTNYPMSVEIRKLAGVGPSGRLLAEYVLQKNHCGESDDQPHFSTFGRHSSISSFHQEKDEEAFYRSMYDEIEKIVTKQENSMATNQVKLQKILLNNSPKAISPNVIASLPEVQRARTSHGYLGKSKRQISSKRSITSAPMLKEPSHTSLLLPLPYVSGYDLVSRQSNVSNKINTTPQRFSVSPNPYQGKLEGLLIHRRDKPQLPYNTPRDYYLTKQRSNIGLTSAERLHGFLNATAPATKSSTDHITAKQLETPPLASAVV